MTEILEDDRAFCGAILAFGDWDRGGPEPEISFRNGNAKISKVCDEVLAFTDAMPEEYFGVLCYEMDKMLEGRRCGAELPAKPEDRSYASGARCLKSLIAYRKTLFHQS